ncbi:WYL domain-containing protein [Desulfatiglans anilini]|uniref:WYL domain-containing protein n=1 Tax=Desulfatiglans anilini TaxID=90728 RepID=UPI0004889B04|nr:WYL domain-containing protein [Desulfatiglans anilini]
MVAAQRIRLGKAAVFVAERVWSPNRKIVRKRNGNTTLIFSPSSKPEVLPWVLSFGDEARLIKPKRLVRDMKENIKKMDDVYSVLIREGEHSKLLFEEKSEKF